MRPGHWIFTIPLRLRSLFRSAQADQELDDELRDQQSSMKRLHESSSMTKVRLASISARRRITAASTKWWVLLKMPDTSPSISRMTRSPFCRKHKPTIRKPILVHFSCTTLSS